MDKTLENSALVVIDLQKGIVSMETRPHPAKDVVANCVRLVEAFRAAGKPIFLVHVDFLGPDTLRPLCDVAPTG